MTITQNVLRRRVRGISCTHVSFIIETRSPPARQTSAPSTPRMILQKGERAQISVCSGDSDMIREVHIINVHCVCGEVLDVKG